MYQRDENTWTNQKILFHICEVPPFGGQEIKNNYLLGVLIGLYQRDENTSYQRDENTWTNQKILFQICEVRWKIELK